jgi:hypothetical protein
MAAGAIATPEIDFEGFSISTLASYIKALKFFFRGFPLDADFLYLGAWWPATAPIRKLLQLLYFTLGNHFHRAIRAVHHPSRQP